MRVNMGSGAGPPGNSSAGGGRVNGFESSTTRRVPHLREAPAQTITARLIATTQAAKVEPAPKGNKACASAPLIRPTSTRVRRAQEPMSSSACSEPVSPRRQPNAAMKAPISGPRPFFVALLLSTASPSASSLRFDTRMAPVKTLRRP